VIAVETSIEIEQGITEAQHDRIGELRGESLGRYKSYSTHIILGPLSAAIAGRIWEYLCDEGVKTTLVREERITFDPNAKEAA
jgi:hypothetical protein